ncbi:MAG: hypothetical protein WCK86_22625, partial [Planctomycetia bacterium]
SLLRQPAPEVWATLPSQTRDGSGAQGLFPDATSVGPFFGVTGGTGLSNNIARRAGSRRPVSVAGGGGRFRHGGLPNAAEHWKIYRLNLIKQLPLLLWRQGLQGQYQLRLLKMC